MASGKRLSCAVDQLTGIQTRVPSALQVLAGSGEANGFLDRLAAHEPGWERTQTQARPYQTMPEPGRLQPSQTPQPRSVVLLEAVIWSWTVYIPPWLPGGMGFRRVSEAAHGLGNSRGSSHPVLEVGRSECMRAVQQGQGRSGQARLSGGMDCPSSLAVPSESLQSSPVCVCVFACGCVCA